MYLVGLSLGWGQQAMATTTTTARNDLDLHGILREQANNTTGTGQVRTRLILNEVSWP